ncbi:ribbon-helix-helix domain-containing protein [Sciscionella sediminilitoris]|uniref:ribbon-helix-helix domain-containing protein n=1 Tax=Sciscionella sediminilitoris TaxID=1445613 RepID=UPI001E5EB0A9|nr:ribbon-helix-helix domain-containing protein [Sciscionella sp. SE31]
MSVSLSEEDVRFLEEYADKQGYSSRSAALQRAVQLLRSEELAEAYEDAWSSWSESEDAQVWETVSGDGLGD